MAPIACAATWQVGPSRTYKTPNAVVNLVANSDTIAIDAATYTNDYVNTWAKNNLTLCGVGGRPILLSTYQPPNLKAIWVISGTNTTVENVEFTGARLSSTNGGNGAGIRQQADTLTLRNCSFHDNNDGILVDTSATSDILIDSCEFYNNGYTNTADNPNEKYVGYAHNMYIGQVRTFTIRYSYSHASIGQGHLLKSRALTNYILYSRLTEESNGNASYEVNLPQGGLSFVVGNLIEKGANAANHGRIIDYSDEGTKNPIQNLYLANNTIVNDYGGSPFFVWIDSSAPSPSGKAVNNLFIGNGTLSNGVGTAVFTNNLALTYAQRTQLVNCASYDYHLIPFAAAIDKGVSPGVYSNFDLTPVSEYVHPSTCGVRQVEAALDQGAYECTDANGDGIEDNWQRHYFGSLTNALAAPNAYPGGNGFTTRQDYLAGLDPTNANSRLAIQAIEATSGGIAVNWLGGTSVWQYVETRQNLSNAAEAWQVIYTNAPTLQSTNRALLGGLTNQTLFFRISAGQP